MDAEARALRNQAIRAAIEAGGRVKDVAAAHDLSRHMVCRIAAAALGSSASRAFGVPDAVWQAVDPRWRMAYAVQKSNARRRGIAWEFNLSSWLAVWESSGLLTERGRKLDQYCMARHGDVGPYAPGNVSIKTNQENWDELNDVHGREARGVAAMAAWRARATAGLL